MSGPSKTAVTVVIAGEEYAIRSDAPAQYTRECAAHVDRAIGEILRHGSLVEVHKAVILAALSLADQLFQARAEADARQREIARLADQLTTAIELRFATDTPPEKPREALHRIADSR